ncbi:MAG: nucleotide disphospho-sugar-binding domain-containing protein [Terracidiphilus sp.]
MARIGAFCFPGTGHLNPLTALARRLQQRGHSVVIFGIADVESQVKSAGIEFCLIGQSDYPPGTLKKLDRQLGELKGLDILWLVLKRVKNAARMVFRDGLDAVRRAKVDALLVDEADMAGSVADYLHLPFVSLALIPPMVWDNRLPPFCFSWSARQGWFWRLRNEIALRVLSRIAAPLLTVVNQQRTAWGLKPLKRLNETLSTLAQIAQLPEVLDFEVDPRPPLLYYTGPFVDSEQRPKADFDWSRLDGRPLVYASLGTLQNQSREMFRNIADACAGLDVQLVMSLGGGLEREQLGALSGDPLVVDYAPQLELIARSSLVITHAGLNTALESMAEGVPMVCIPMGNDQPGIAARVAARGAAVVVPPRKANADRLRSAVRSVLEDESYRRAARKVQAAMSQIDGLERAADIVEDVLKIGSGVRAQGATNQSLASATETSAPLKYEH